MPTLAELRARARTSAQQALPRAERTVTLIEGQHLLAESKRLDEERTDLLMRAQRDAEQAAEDGRDRTVKAGQRPRPTIPPRVKEIRTRLAELYEELSEHQGVVGLGGVSGGEWQRFKDDHPAREDSLEDLQVAKGACNASALFQQLGRFVVSWNGEELVEGDWDGWLAESITYADRRDLVTEVVDMFEENLPRVPKSPSGSSSTETSATD